ERHVATAVLPALGVFDAEREVRSEPQPLREAAADAEQVDPRARETVALEGGRLAVLAGDVDLQGRDREGGVLADHRPLRTAQARDGGGERGILPQRDGHGFPWREADLCPDGRSGTEEHE